MSISKKIIGNLEQFHFRTYHNNYSEACSTEDHPPCPLRTGHTAPQPEPATRPGLRPKPLQPGLYSSHRLALQPGLYSVLYPEAYYAEGAHHRICPGRDQNRVIAQDRDRDRDLAQGQDRDITKDGDQNATRYQDRDIAQDHNQDRAIAQGQDQDVTKNRDRDVAKDRH